jgi:hemolysin activation/secretion protein
VSACALRTGLCLLLLASASGVVSAAPAGEFPRPDGARWSLFDLGRPGQFEIPDADARPRVPNAGPYFEVRDLRITGIEDMPEVGLALEDLQAEARRALADQGEREEIAARGYSDEELTEVAGFLERVESRRDDTAITKVALMDELIDLLGDLKKQRGVSVYELETVARAVQDRIRARGVILAQVVVPPQTVRDGVVELRVYPGLLGEVTVANNRVYRGRSLERAFASVTGETVTLEGIEQRLRLINDLEGMDVSGVFVPGQAVGETALRLNVLNERRWRLLSRLDNHGADVTGRRRGFLELALFDPTGAADQFTAGFLRSEGEDPVELYNFRYRRPLGGVRQFLEAAYSRNEFSIGGVNDILGDTRNYRIDHGIDWLRTRQRNLRQTSTIAFKDARLAIGPTNQDQEILEVGTDLSYDSLVPGWQMILDGTTSLRAGEIRSGRIEGAPDPAGGVFAGQADRYWVFNQRARIYKLFEMPLPFSEARSRHSLLLRFDSQYAREFLPAVSRVPLGGADRVRSYLSDDIAVDRGAFLSAQLYWELPESMDFDMPWARQRFSEFLRPFLFYDYAYGVTNAERTNVSNQSDKWFELGSYGLGLEYNLLRGAGGGYHLRGSLSWAFPERSRFDDPVFDTIIEEEDRVYLDLTLEFDQGSLGSLWRRARGLGPDGAGR